MPRVNFEQLPLNARIWIFASDRPLTGNHAHALLQEVDRFLDQWKAHGAPLRSGRDWREDRFLVIGVDPTAEQASGCSIDGLFRGLQQLERSLSTSLVAGGRVFYRDAQGTPQVAARKDVPALFEQGVLTGTTSVFDTSITDKEKLLGKFERPARDTWVAALLPSAQASQAASRSATNSSSAKKG
jgi:hypothetical protein